MMTSVQPRLLSSQTSALPMNPAPPVTSTRRPCHAFCISAAGIFLSFAQPYYTVPAFQAGAGAFAIAPLFGAAWWQNWSGKGLRSPRRLKFVGTYAPASGTPELQNAKSDPLGRLSPRGQPELQNCC